MIALVDTRQEYRDLFDVYWPIGAGVGVLFALLIVGFALRFRRRSGDAPPPDLRETPKAEGTYIAVLAAVCAFLVYLTFHVMGDDVADLPGEPSSIGQTDAAVAATPRPVARVRATASRWNWRFDYPDAGVTQVGTGTQIPTLVVPQGDVQLRLVSLDVIHAFYIPYLRFKRDAFPERPTNFTLGFDKLGFHHAWGECAEFCGLRHAYMQFNVQVLSRPGFEAWLRARRAGRPQRLTPMLDDGGDYR